MSRIRISDMPCVTLEWGNSTILHRGRSQLLRVTGAKGPWTMSPVENTMTLEYNLCLRI